MSIYSMKAGIKDANLVFKKINPELSPKHKGEIVAIDSDSGNYFIGSSELEAYKKAIMKYPNKQFVFKRIGFASTHFIGAL